MILLTQNTEESTKPEKKRKKRNRRPFLVGFFSFLLSLILMAALALAIPVTLLRYLLTDHNIEVIVDRIIDTVEVDKIEIPSENGSKNLTGVILDFTSQIEGLDLITEEQINEVLLDDFAKQLITDILKQYGLSLTSGTEVSGITPEHIYSFIEENRDTIEQLAREAGYEGEIPLIDKKEEIISTISSSIGGQTIAPEALLGAGEIEQIRAALDTAQLVFSDSALYLVWGIVVFVAMLLFFLNIKFIGCFCRACGFPALIIGGIYTLAAYAVEPLLKALVIENEIVAELVNFTVGFTASLLAGIATPTAAIGLALILASIAIGIVRTFASKSKK